MKKQKIIKSVAKVTAKLECSYRNNLKAAKQTGEYTKASNYYPEGLL